MRLKGKIHFEGAGIVFLMRSAALGKAILTADKLKESVFEMVECESLWKQMEICVLTIIYV